MYDLAKPILVFILVIILFVPNLLFANTEKTRGLTPFSAELINLERQCDECEAGYRLLRDHEYKAAEKYWRAIFKTASNHPTKKAIALQQIAVTQQFEGRSQAAKNTLHLAIRLLANVGAPTLLGSIYYQLGVLEIRSGKFAAAKLDLQNAIRLIDIETNIGASAIIENKIGELYTLQNDAEQALPHYTKSFKQFQLLKQYAGALQAARNAILSTLSLKKYSHSVELFTRALSIIEGISGDVTTATARISLIDVLNSFPISEMGKMNVKYVHAVLLLKQIYQTPTLDTFNQVYALSVMAELYYQTGNIEEAQRILSKVIMRAQLLGPNQFIVRSLILSGKIYRSQAKLDRSIQAYQLAVKHYADIRTDMPQLIAKDVFGLHGNEIDGDSLYLSLADLLLAKAQSESSLSKSQQLLVQARDIIERQKVTELQNYFNNTCDLTLASPKKSIDSILDKNSAAIYPIILPDRIVVLVTFSTGLQQFLVKENSAKVKSVVNEFRRNLENLNSDAYYQQAQQIYNWVIAPLEAEFAHRGINTLIVVSEKMFRTIPLAVLHDGKQYLIEKYALAVVPGLQLVDPRPLNRKKLRVLLSGISESVQGYPPLRYVQGELEEIQDLYVTKLLLNKEFVTKNFEQAMQKDGFNIAHLASHSEFSGDINDSYILTYNGKMSMQRLGNITSLARRNNQPIELLTLSSCQTAVGDDKAALGLAGVALKAGARSAIATLWSIDDFASSILVSEFYRQLLNESLSKAQALQRAQLKLIASRRFDHPAYWSSFLLIGNWL